METLAKLYDEYTVDLRYGSVKRELDGMIYEYILRSDLATLLQHCKYDEMNFKLIYPDKGLEPTENSVTIAFLKKLDACMERVNYIDLKNVTDANLKEKFQNISAKKLPQLIGLRMETQIPIAIASQFNLKLEELHCRRHDFQLFIDATEIEILSLNLESVDTPPLDLSEIMAFVNQNENMWCFHLTYTSRTLSNGINKNVSISEILHSLSRKNGKAFYNLRINNNSNGQFFEYSSPRQLVHTNHIALIPIYSCSTLEIGRLTSLDDVYAVAMNVSNVKAIVLDVDEMAVGTILSDKNKSLMGLFPDNLDVIITTSATNRLEKYRKEDILHFKLFVDDSDQFFDEIPTDVQALKVISRGNNNLKDLAIKILSLESLQNLCLKGKIAIVLMEQFNGKLNHFPSLHSLKVQHSEKIVSKVKGKVSDLIGLSWLRFLSIILETNINLDNSRISLDSAIPKDKQNIWHFECDKFLNHLKAVKIEIP